MLKATKTQIFTLVFIILISGLLCLNNFVNVPFLASSKIMLGLDLQGGTDILLEVNTRDYIKNYKTNIEKNIKKDLYDEKIAYKNFILNNDSFSFEIRDQKSIVAVKKILRRNLVKFKNDGALFEMDISDNTTKELVKKVVEQSIEVIRKRVDELGNKEISINGVDENKISLQIPGENNADDIKRLLNTQAKLSFHLIDDVPLVKTKQVENPNIIAMESDQLSERFGSYYYAVFKDAIIDGADLESATATFTEQGEAGVSFSFNSKAAAIFGEVTTQNIGKPFAIVLDGKVLSAPNIREPILGGSGVISGAFTTQEANELALLLRAGALPAEIIIVKQQNISATLGKESVVMGVKAMVIGTILVMIYMLYRYRILGAFAVISLLVNVACVVGFLALFNSTLTLPGIAGMILTIGMAVDGNIIIFENIGHLQEKMQKKMVFAEAFDESTSSILDANITTILACIMLYQFGFGAIRGFALTLIIGVLFSVMSSLFVTKVFIGIYYGRKKMISAL